jgi:arylsulfatase A-like enzyme
MKKLFTLALTCCLFQGIAMAGERPNILFIITDDMYTWQMNFMPDGAGKNYTPNIDRLAEEGTVMRNQYVSSTVCTPSRYSVMTGRYASRAQDPKFLAHTAELGQSHVQWNTFADPEKEQTVANRLGEIGYRTGFVGKDHAVLTTGRTHLGLSSDVDDPAVQAAMQQNAQASEMALNAAGFEYVSRVYHNNPDFNGSMTLAVHNQDWITEGALEFLDAKDDRPFFLYFATTTPHGPTEDDRSWNANRRATPEGWLDYTPEVQPDAASIARRAREHGVEGRETIIWIDDAIGALLNKLDETGELDNTVIFFFNDHGQTAKGSVYEGGAHNPSVVWRHGGWPAGGESHALVSNIDFAPTMMDLAGAGPQSQVDGVSFLPVLEKRAEKVRDSLFFEMGYTRGVLKDNFKYIALRYPPSVANLTREERQANLDHMNNNLRARGRPVHTEDPMKPFGHLMPVPGGHDAEQGAVRAYPHYYDADQLYNLAKDPGERMNLFKKPKYREQMESLQILLQSYLVTLPGDFPLNTDP